MLRWAVLAVAIGDGTGHIVGELVSAVLAGLGDQSKWRCARGPSSTSAELVLRGQDPLLDRGSFDLCHDRGYLDEHAACGGGGVDAVVYAYDPLISLLTPLKEVVGVTSRPADPVEFPGDEDVPLGRRGVGEPRS